jgi:Methyltransferase domain
MADLFDRKLLKHHVAESHKRLPGPDYQKVLRWIHHTLKPSLYIEIGVCRGDSLTKTLPTTKTIGVDPAAKWGAPRNADFYPMTSDDFFAQIEAGAISGVQDFSLAFIDGLHTYDQALRDFINLEKLSSPNSVIMLHDCIPLDEISASNPRASHFYTGDVWKTLLILVRNRPDLKICIVPTWPSGLVLVGSLDSKSKVLGENFSTIVDQYRPLTFNDYLSTVSELPPPSPLKEAAVQQFLQAA